MGKQVVTRYSLPLTDEERSEIREILKKPYEEKERWDMAQELHAGLLGTVRNFLNHVGPEYHARFLPGGIGVLNKQLKEITSEWFSKYTVRLGADIRPDDINVSISTDGLYILTYSDTVKQIITMAGFNMTVFTYAFPQEDHLLVEEVNKYLEQENPEE